MLKTKHSFRIRHGSLITLFLLSSLTVSAQLSVSLEGENPLCFGLASGSITSTVSGGTIPYTYNWSNGEETPFISNLTAGLYGLTVTDALGATGEASITLTEPSLVTVDLSADQACSAPFTLTANGNGGVGSYTYNWSTGESTASIIVNDELEYCVTVVDGNGCGTFDCIDIVINSPDVEVVAIDVLCFGDTNGSLTATATDGTPPYSYSWSNGDSGATISNLAAGTYGVTVTDANGCMATTSGTVNEPPELTTTTQSVHDVCPGEATGGVMVLPVGGTPPYTYLWSTGATTQGEATLPAGVYTVTVTDANGCTAVDDIEIVELPGPEVSISGDPIICGIGNTTDLTATATGGTGNYQYEWNTGALVPTITVGSGAYSVTVTDGNGCTDEASISVSLIDVSITLSSTDVICNGDENGTATVTVSGGDMPYTYEWSNGATTPMITGLAPGIYTVEVEEANGCKAMGMITVSEPPPISIIGEVSDILCFGLETGAIDIFAVGGTAPFTYDWADLPGTNDPQDRMGLAAGTYTVTVTDANGCTAMESYTIIEPSQLILTGEVADVLCIGDENGAIDLTVNGGTPPYIYNWSTGATTQDLNGLGAGTYTVTVVDDNGCGRTEEYTVNEPLPLDLNVVVTDVLCPGESTGAIDLMVSGGTPPYTYSWSNGVITEDLDGLAAGSYTVTVTDANGCTASATVTINEPPALMLTVQVTNILCNGDATGAIDLTVTGGVQPYTFSWSNGVTTEDLDGLTAGSYNGTVTDANGCTASATVTVMESPALMLSAQVTNVPCAGDEAGAIDLTVTGGTPPYTYNWSNGATTQDLDGLSAGDYTGSVTDANGCTASATLTVDEPTALDLSAVTTDVLCAGDETGAIDLTVTGGTPPYTYSWSNGATTQDLDGLAAGSYTGTVTDANGCTASAMVTINELPALMLSAEVTDILCTGGATGTIDLTVTGGVQPYVFSWSNGATSEDLDGLTAGSYTGTVTDANGCTASATVTVTEPPALMLSAEVTDVPCAGDETGAIDLTVTGGTPPYTYSWSNGATTQDIDGLAAGDYTGTVTDANGCTAMATLTVDEASDLDVSAVSTNVLCAGDETGAIDLTVTGGTPPYTYSWSNGATTQDLDGLAAGSYTGTVTDANGCTAVATVTITEPPALMISAEVTDASCAGEASGAIDLTVTGGVQPYTYSWSNGATTEDVSSLAAGSYTAIVTDANGCTVQITETVDEPGAIEVVTQAPIIECGGTASGSITAIPSGGTGPYTYMWSNGGTGSFIENLPAGIYSVTVTDANSCTATADAISLSELPELSCEVVVLQEPTMGNNGSLSVNIDGGTLPFSYSWSTGATTQTITGLMAGTYTVTVTDANNCTTECTGTLQPLAGLGDFVWEDFNNNGQQDPGEPGVPGVTVKLKNEAGVVIATTTTNGSGFYSFTGLVPGTYSVMFNLPDGFEFTGTDQGDDATDSDADPAMDGMTGNYTLAPGEFNMTIDAGLVRQPCIDNITNPGTIGFNQEVCGPGNVPNALIELTPAMGGIGQIEYLWMYNTVDPGQDISFWHPIPNSNSINYSPGPLQQTTYFTRCVRRDDCPYLESNIIVVEVGDDAVAIIDGPELGCENEEITFSALGTGPGAVISWSFSGDANTSGNSGPSVTASWGSFGVHSVTLTVTENGCTSTTSRTISIVTNPVYCGGNITATGTVNSMPTRDVTIEWSMPNDGYAMIYAVEHSLDGENFESVGTVEEADVVIGEIALFSFQDVAPIAGRNFYRVHAFDQWGADLVSNVVELQLAEDNGQLGRIFPNPTTNGSIHIEMLNAPLGEDLEVQLLSANGSVISTQTLFGGAGVVDLELDEQAAGVYFVRLLRGDEVETHRVVVSSN